MDSILVITGYGKFNEQAEAAIRHAQQGGTVTLNTKCWISFNHLVIDALAERKDVTLIVNYVYKGENKTLTIPAGSADIGQYLNDDGYVGFEFLQTIFGEEAE